LGVLSEEVKAELLGHQIAATVAIMPGLKIEMDLRLYIDGKLVDSTKSVTKQYGPKAAVTDGDKTHIIEVYLVGFPFLRRLVLRIDGQEIARSTG
jgi:hypothetical protein